MAGGPHERTAFLARPAPFFRNFSGANADGRRAGKDIEKVEIHVVLTAARGAPLGAAPRAPPPARLGLGHSLPTDRSMGDAADRMGEKAERGLHCHVPATCLKLNIY